MNESRISISVDVSQSNSPVRVMCKQGDTGRVLLISLTDGGYPYVISKDCYAVFTAVKPDGKIICNPCQILNGVIIYTFTAQTCACPGNMTAEIRLYGDGDKLLTSASFLMCVDKTVYRDGDPVVSDSEITLLTRLISETNALNQEIRDSLESGAFIGPTGPQGPQGVPGEVSFSDLSEEQRESLRGDQGPQGETGSSGVYIGTEPPVDPDVNVWIDPEGDAEELSEIAKQAAEILQPDLSQIKSDLANVQSAVSEKMDSYTIKTVMDSVATPHTQYYLGNQTAVDIVLPDTSDVGQIITVCWYNGETAATLSITGTMLDFDYTPGANSRSEINALWDGLNWAVLGNEMAVVADA